MYLAGNLTYECEAGMNESSRNTMRLEHLASSEIGNLLEKYTSQLEALTNDLEVARQNVDAPFDRADELAASSKRMEELDQIFSKPDDIIAQNSEGEEKTQEKEVKKSVTGRKKM